MKIGMPNNLFTRLLRGLFPEAGNLQPVYQPASLLSNCLEAGKLDVALVPTLDLIKHRNFFVSSGHGISFEGTVSNAFLYFSPNQHHMKDLSLQGDVSGLEAILAKILIAEMYDDDVFISISGDPAKQTSKNKLIAGDGNWENDAFEKGLSFTEEINELLSLPFVNYIFVSKSQTHLENLHKLLPVIDNSELERISRSAEITAVGGKAAEFLSENVHNIIYNFDEHDKYGIVELMQLPYLHGIIPDILDVRFV